MYIYTFLYIYKCLKICQLNIIKKLKKDYKKGHERQQNLPKEKKEKKVTIKVF